VTTAGYGRVSVEDPLERGPDGIELWIVEARFGIGGRVAGREEHRVARAQRHLQRLGQPHDHRASGQRPASLDEADVPLGGPGPQCELELADASALTPLPEYLGDAGAVRVRRHRSYW
jgi:hypothetical protein